MRHVIALFDAPIPAIAALRTLADAGFTPDDLACVANTAKPGDILHDQGVPGAAEYAAATLPYDENALTRRLESCGLDSHDAATCAEGVARRGAILVVATGPTLSARVAERALDGSSPPTLSEHRARWSGRRGEGLTRYGWADLPAPRG